MFRNSKFHSLLRLSGYLKKHRLALCFVFLFAIISTVFSVLAPYVTGQITTVLYQGVSSGHFDMHRIWQLVALLVALYLSGALFGYLQNFGMAKITAEVMYSLRQDIDRKMNRMTLDFYDTHTNGEVLSVITNDVDMINGVLSDDLTDIVTQVITAVGILVMMIAISPWLALIAVGMVALSLLSSRRVVKASETYYARQQKELGDLNGYIEEIYTGESIVQLYNYQEHVQERYKELNDALQKSAQTADTASGTIAPLTTLFTNLGYVLIAVIGCIRALQGQMPVGSIQAMLQYTRQFSQPFTDIAETASDFGSASAAADRIFGLLDMAEESPDPVPGKVPAQNDGTVDFSHVQFGYTKDKLLMHDVNLQVKSGQKIAIVGPTGAGKTTLVNLLMRFYEINGGEIEVDGVNTKEMTRDELRRHFGMVLQDTWLFEGTVAENLAYSRDDLSEAQIEEAAEAAGADSFIRQLPGGYKANLSENGDNLSQGQRQLLTIARAMASDPEIMILDEATSNVDVFTEQTIQQAMAKLMKGRTSFVIAHRLATIKDADLILYMENGDIKETGTHEQLMKKNGKYAALYNSQFA